MVKHRLRTWLVSATMLLGLITIANTYISPQTTTVVSAATKKDANTNKDKDKNNKDKDKDKQNAGKTNNIDNNNLDGASGSGDTGSDPYSKLVTGMSDSDSDQYKKIASDAPTGGNAWGTMAGKNTFFGLTTQSSYSTSYVTLFSGWAKQKMNSATAIAGSYGLGLINTGLDHSASDGMISSTFSAIGRILGGIIFFLGYILNEGVGWLFGWVAKLVGLVNPVTWANSVPSNSPLHSVAQLVNNMYKSVSSLGMIGAALGLGVGIFAAIVGWKKTTAGGMAQAGTRMLARIFIILLMPLLLGSFFATVSKQVADQFDNSSSPAANYAVYSGLVDFQGWVEHSRLSMPNGHLNALTATDDPKDTGVISRTDVLQINALGAGRAGAASLLQSGHGYSLTSKSQDGTNKALSMITNWMSDAKYQPSDWASYTKARLANTNKGVNAMKNAGNVLKSNSVYYTNGTLNADSKFGTLHTNAPNIQWNGNTATSSGKLSLSAPGGLSTIGMYNYLSTNFTDSDMTWTAGPKLTNAFTAPVHKTIGLVGRGPRAMANFLLSAVLMWMSALLGLYVALGLVTSLFKGVLDIVTHLIGAGLGSLSQGLKLILAVFAVLIELEVGAIFYAVASQLLIAITSAFDSMLSSKGVNGVINLIATNGAKPGTPGYSAGLIQAGAISGTAYTTGEFLLALVLIWVTFKLVKYRGVMSKTFYTGIESTFKSIFGSADRALGGHGQTSGLNNPAVGGNAANGGAPGASRNGHNGRDGSGHNGFASAGKNGASGKATNGTDGSAGKKGFLGRTLGGPGAFVNGASTALQAKEAKTGKPNNFLATASTLTGYTAQKAGQAGLMGLGALGTPGAAVAGAAWSNHQANKAQSRLGAGDKDDQAATDAMNADPYGQSQTGAAHDMSSSDAAQMLRQAMMPDKPLSGAKTGKPSGAASDAKSASKSGAKSDKASGSKADNKTGKPSADKAKSSAAKSTDKTTHDAQTGKPQAGKSAAKGADAGKAKAADTKSGSSAQTGKPQAGENGSNAGTTSAAKTDAKTDATGKPQSADTKRDTSAQTDDTQTTDTTTDATETPQAAVGDATGTVVAAGTEGAKTTVDAATDNGDTSDTTSDVTSGDTTDTPQAATGAPEAADAGTTDGDTSTDGDDKSASNDAQSGKPDDADAPRNNAAGVQANREAHGHKDEVTQGDSIHGIEPGTAAPQTMEAANAQVQSAMAQTRQADAAVQDLAPDASKADQKSARAQQTKARQSLKAARQTATNMMSQQPLPPQMGHAQKGVKPTIGKAYPVLQQMRHVYGQAQLASKNGDTQMMAQSAKKLTPLVKQAKQMGLNKEAYAGPQGVNKSLAQLNARFQTSFNGTMAPKQEPKMSKLSSIKQGRSQYLRYLGKKKYQNKK